MKGEQEGERSPEELQNLRNLPALLLLGGLGQEDGRPPIGSSVTQQSPEHKTSSRVMVGTFAPFVLWST